MKNHPQGSYSDELDNQQEIARLIEAGQQAMEQQSFQEAANNFRQALRLAPFRSDIKEMLALALAGRPISARPGHYNGEKDKKAEAPTGMVNNFAARVKPRETRLILSAGLCAVIGVLLVIIFLGLFTLYNETIKSTIIKITGEKQAAPVISAEAAELYRVVETYLKQGRYDDAITKLKTALNDNPVQEAGIKARLADSYYRKAQSLYNQEKFTLAAECYAQAASYRSSADYFYQAGWAFYKAGREAELNKRSAQNLYHRAIKAYEQAINLEPQHLLAYLELARVNIRVNRPQQAIRLYEKIIDLAPDSQEANKARRSLQSMLGKSIQ